MDKTLSDGFNGRLTEVSQLLFGEKAKLTIVDPRKLILLKKNARYMQKPMFDQLTSNIERDGFLSSVPLCQEKEDGRLEVLSGNHRVKAAIRADISQIMVIAIPQQTKNRKVAIQLSHNALEGLDDHDILAELWNGLENLNDQLYSGLDTEFISNFDPVEFHGFSAAQPQSKCLVLWFLPEEIESMDDLLLEAEVAAAADRVYLAPVNRYEELFEALVQTKKFRNIKNTSVAFMWLMNRLIDRTVFDGLGTDDEI
ncbi:MAG: ParB N-terminal domain-containing protein [Planctomycetaceae bacterium]|nr:ParB N-terminal domain-containing protein [Planctomycetaceae bacterium]MBT6155296.1 ParB N-terminal domain-containing protein [Planctomycetaceae bacterium]MBT6485208.1 ParB N-terminal domain-containing protein [Planctomycetaceae bacterium]MBT6497107.1 ParB N-terminal domain-containing protein [Planctomycetaceae bacterium]